MRYTKIILAGLIALGGLWTSDAYAAEKRCDELGANCVCSEPFNTASMVPDGSNWWNPADSTTKECSVEYDGSHPGSPVHAYAGAYPITAGNDAVALAALPQPAGISHFLRSTNGYTGEFEIGHTQAYSPRSAYIGVLPGNWTLGPRTAYVSIKRMAARWYFYSSSDWQATEGTCTNGGKRGIPDVITLSTTPSPDLTPGLYNFFEYGPYFLDCCPIGPRNASDSGGPTITQIRGKWWRQEMVVTNRLGGVGNGNRIEVFMKNVTDNQPEIRVVDTNGDVSGSAHIWVPSPDLTPPNIYSPAGALPLRAWTHSYRAGPCAGWIGYSHFLMAQWDTDTGQRIGAATEIEGGGSLPSIPSPIPTLRIR